MKYSRLFISSLLIIIFFVFIASCKKNSTGSDKPEYYDLQWIWLGEKTTHLSTNPDYPGITRDSYVYFLGENPGTASATTLFQNDVDWLHYWGHQCKWVHYYEDDHYIEFEEVGENEPESFGTSDYLVQYKNL